MSKAEEKFDAIQKKTYTRWANSFLKRRGKEIKDLFDDINDGVLLISLLEIIGNESVSTVMKQKAYDAPKNINQRGENVNLAINYVKSKGIELVNVGSGDFEKKNQRIILGFFFTVILRFSVADLDGKKGLLLWCQRSTEKHEGVNVKNFTNSFTDGLAFCAIINRYRPDLINFNALNKADHKGNLELAFATAQKLGIDRLLDVEDLLDNPAPDEKSIIAYVIEYWRLFSKGQANEQLLKIIFDSLKVANQIKALGDRYNFDAAELLAWIADKKAKYGDTTFPDYTEGIVDAIGSFNEYTKTDKSAEKGKLVALEALLQQIDSQTREYGFKEFVPTAGQDLPSIKGEWASLGVVEDAYKAEAVSKYDRFLRYDYNVRLFDSKLARMNSWIDENAAVFAGNQLGSTVEDIDAKLDAYAIYKTNFASLKDSEAELKGIGSKVGKEHHGSGHIAEALGAVSSKLKALSDAGNVYQANLHVARDNIVKLNNLQKSYYVKAEELLFKIEGLEELISMPVLEGSEEGLNELSNLLGDLFSRRFNEVQDGVNEFKAVAATLIAGGKTLSRDANLYDDLLTELQSKLNARNRSLAMKIGVVRKDEELKVAFADAATNVTSISATTSASVGRLSGTLEAQLSSLNSIDASFRADGGAALNSAKEAWAAMEAAGILVCKNTSETIYSLQSAYQATVEGFGKTAGNIHALIAARDGAKAEEAERLNEIRKAFDFFDVDHNNVLRDTEFAQACEGLGLLVDETTVGAFYNSNVNSAKGGLVFEKFVEFVKENSSSGTGKADVLNAFTTLSKSTTLSEDVIKSTFAENPELILSALNDYKTAAGFDYKAYVDSLFA
jgi:hypothetical protein